jgi:endothelin-converting enzyme
VDPCEDFYNFTCGGWEAINTIPQGYGRYSTFDQLADLNSILLQKVLESGDDSGVDAVKKMMTLYRSCMDTDTIDEKGADPLIYLINGTGGWGLVGIGSNESDWSINSSYVYEFADGSSAFFNIAVGVDDKNTSRYVLTLSQSGLSLPSKDSYSANRTAEQNKKALRTFITSVLTLINPSVDVSAYEEAADEIVEFESQLAEVFVSSTDLRDPEKLYNKMTLDNLTSLFPQLDWVNFVSEILANTSVNVTGSLEVIVQTPTYFSNLTKVYAAANESTLENYAKWHLIITYLPALSSDFLTALDTFLLATTGEGSRQRYQTCLSIVQEIMPIALARPFTDFILPRGTKANVSVMIEEVKAAFKVRLQEKAWLDETTKKRCVEKVDAITKMVAYPDQIDNDTYLNDLYEGYHPAEMDYFGNYMLFVNGSLADNLDSLPDPVDKSVWLNAPTAVNAYYSPQFNQFVFLEGILNTPFFQAGWPEYFQYGALGVVIGHELTHGFDDEGQQYDGNGTLRHWWTNASVEAFKKRQVCFEKQYSQYELFGYNINGNLTLGENIADNGGLHTSYQAFMSLMNTTQQPTLPALKYTPEQLYFIGFSQLWCSLYTEEFIASDVKTNPHSPGPYRVIGALVNSKEFADAFQCKEGSRMNPKDKCELW